MAVRGALMVCGGWVAVASGRSMNATIEERLAALEEQVSRLLVPAPVEPIWRDGWESTVGMAAGDPGFEEMIRLGAEWRREANRDAADARSATGPA